MHGFENCIVEGTFHAAFAHFVSRASMLGLRFKSATASEKEKKLEFEK